ncbi:uncharacterized protein N0V89_000486 [Didymosphaeria variabile]|uniref:DUF4419 domain-containing protein n=1 Tax=Didymosphaeria variabile TaxID=1932322 RepID=A0A9W9CFS7_9PLEO|nr:uncharacterized protein N0V89_000486 [Didymosphaeria variabile]KAJ4359927.1 hypothetical protein N0V89_000486 [Didymosphaeria variabile]
MPVTIKPSPEKVGVNTDTIATNRIDLLEQLERMKHPHASYAKPVYSNISCKPIMHSSFEDIGKGTSPNLIPYANGFFEGIVRAYQQDLHLVLRPDDVWQAVITQFSFYVVGHAEELRDKFVAHQGKKEIVLKHAGGSPYAMQVDIVARKLTCLIEEQLVNKQIRNWIIPDFSTTTDNDIAVASMTMMATMKEYFNYRGNTGCGFPSVTLLGERNDWANMRKRLDQLPGYGEQPAEWAKLLVPVFDRFVATFDRPNDEALKTFWLTICHAERNGSGSPDTFSGWMTAFVFWKTDGSRNLLSGWRPPKHQMVAPQLSLDGQVYPRTLQESIPQGVVEVPLVVRDMASRVDLYTQLVAGSAGMSIVAEDENSTTVQPRSGWWMLFLRQKAFDRGDMECDHNQPQ